MEHTEAVSYTHLDVYKRQVLRYEDSVGNKFQPGTNIRITYVFYPNVQTNEQRTLIGFYVNGEESACLLYTSCTHRGHSRHT